MEKRKFIGLCGFLVMIVVMVTIASCTKDVDVSMFKPEYRGVWANENTEVVFTDSILLVYTHDETGNTGLASLVVPSRDVKVRITFTPDDIQTTDAPDYKVTLENGKLIVGNDTLKKVEDIAPTAPYDMPKATDRSTIGLRLQEWQLGSYMESGDGEYFVEIGTNRNSFMFSNVGGMVYLRAAALLQCNDGSLFIQNIRMMKNDNTGERTIHFFDNQLDFLTHLPVIDHKMFTPGKCFFGKNAQIYWSYADHTPDNIQINGCGEIYNISRRTVEDKSPLMEWFKLDTIVSEE